ncbi:hypothetical protein HND97_15660 [Vibrio cholerae]|nr:hypothetical protein HND97_15660 [Vibrio cholerae]
MGGAVYAPQSEVPESTDVIIDALFGIGLKRRYAHRWYRSSSYSTTVAIRLWRSICLQGCVPIPVKLLEHALKRSIR